MKKIVLYVSAAAIIGVLITLVPLITVAQIGIGGNTQKPESLGQGFGQLEGEHGSNNPTVNSSDLAVLAVSFIIALLAYALVGTKAPRRYNLRLGVPPY